MKKVDFIKLCLIVVLLGAIAYVFNKNQEFAKGGSIKLYWLVAEGMRADEDLFQVFQWAKEGELPQIKKLMAGGAFGYSRSALGPRLPEFIKGPPQEKLALISVSETLTDEVQPYFMISNSWDGAKTRLETFTFESDPQMMEASKFKFPVKTFSPRKDINIASRSLVLQASVVDLSNDKEQNYDSLSLSRDGQKIDVTLKPGETSVWFPVIYNQDSKKLRTHLKYQLVSISSEGEFKLKVHVDGLSKASVVPPDFVGKIRSNVGPMVDATHSRESIVFKDEEDRNALLSEMKESLNWHEAFIPYLAKAIAPEVVIHKLYHPRQLFGPHWWLGSLSPEGLLYASTPEEEKAKRRAEVLGFYKRIDQLLGRILISSARDAVIVLSGSFAPTVINQVFHINSFIQKKAWTQIKFDPLAGIQLAGGSATDDSTLMAEVKAALEAVTDPQGQKIFEEVSLREGGEGGAAGLALRVRQGVLLSEDPSADEELFSLPTISGSDQLAFMDESSRPLLPFLITGPGIKKNHAISSVLEFEDQEALVLRALEKKDLGSNWGELFDSGPTSSEVD